MKNYFPHDYNARNDPKCSALINDFGYTGYGLYIAIIEIIHEQGGKIKKFPKLYDGLAFELKIEKEVFTKQIEAMLQQYELLLQDENYIWSNRILKNLENIKIKHEAKVNAGRIGGLKSGNIRQNRIKFKNVDEAKQSVALKQTKQNELNKIRLNKIKLNKIKLNKEEEGEITPSQITKEFFNNFDKQEEVIKTINEKIGIDGLFLKNEINKFISYWTEPTKSGKQQRWETEPTFEITRRLNTWFRNIKQFQNQKQRKITEL